MEPLIYLNGEILPVSEARISPLDRGLLYGDGLFETMRCYGGRVHLLRRHLQRLRSGTEFLGIRIPSSDILIDALRQVVAANGGGDMVVRLTVTRGSGGGVLDPGTTTGPTVLVVPRPVPQSSHDPERIITLGVHHVAPGFGAVLKSLGYLTAIVAARELRSAGVREGILLDHDGVVAEGTTSNLFCVHNEVLYTPSTELGILPGITRGRVIDLAHSCGIEVREVRMFADEYRNADECFYTNSTREIVPVGRIDNSQIGDGLTGTYTRELMKHYRAEAPDEEL